MPRLPWLNTLMWCIFPRCVEYLQRPVFTQLRPLCAAQETGASWPDSDSASDRGVAAAADRGVCLAFRRHRRP